MPHAQRRDEATDEPTSGVLDPMPLHVAVKAPVRCFKLSPNLNRVRWGFLLISPAPSHPLGPYAASRSGPQNPLVATATRATGMPRLQTHAPHPLGSDAPGSRDANANARPF